jgi:hypothetical protein
MRKQYPKTKEIPLAKVKMVPEKPSVHQRTAFFRRCGKRKR